MSRWERRAVYFWAISISAAIFEMIVPGFPLLFLAIPPLVPLAFFIPISPTVSLYVTPALAIYFALRRWRRGLAIALALVIPVSAGFLIPMMVNRQLKRDVASLGDLNHGSRISLPIGATVTLLHDFNVPDRCVAACQRLLFSGTASSVVVGYKPDRHSRQTKFTRFWIGPRKGQQCPGRKLVPVYGRPDEFKGEDRDRLIWDKLDEIELNGKCIFNSPAPGPRADFIFFTKFDYGRGYSSIFDMRLRVVEINFIASIYRRNMNKNNILVSRSSIRSYPLTMPLTIEPPVRLTGSAPGRWGSDSVSIGSATKGRVSFEDLITNDIRITNLTP